ncbi:MAG: hypothetical protein LUE86_06535 [Clostridiales bacterium]|nr:hypothetical protein [Clostridiales bacterium]
MMRKQLITAAFATLLALSAAVPAFAGWQLDESNNRWWFENEDGSWPADCWIWVDDDGDGLYEAYCFDAGGYLLTGVTTPDGYIVDGNGARLLDGAVMSAPAGWIGTYTAASGESFTVVDLDSQYLRIDFYTAGGEENTVLQFAPALSEGDVYTATLPLLDTEGNQIGMNTFTLAEDGSSVTLDSSYLTPGVYVRQN